MLLNNKNSKLKLAPISNFLRSMDSKDETVKYILKDMEHVSAIVVEWLGHRNPKVVDQGSRLHQF